MAKTFKLGDTLEIPGKRGKTTHAVVRNVYPNGDLRWVEVDTKGQYMWDLPLYVIARATHE